MLLLGVVEGGDDLGGFGFGEATVEEAVFGAGGPEGEGDEAGEEDEGGGADAGGGAGENDPAVLYAHAGDSSTVLRCFPREAG